MNRISDTKFRNIYAYCGYLFFIQNQVIIDNSIFSGKLEYEYLFYDFFSLLIIFLYNIIDE